jgi:hypothetical protein
MSQYKSAYTFEKQIFITITMKIIWLNNKQLNVLGATAVLFPTVYGAQKKFTKRKEKLILKK